MMSKLTGRAASSPRQKSSTEWRRFPEKVNVSVLRSSSRSNDCHAADTNILGMVLESQGGPPELVSVEIMDHRMLNGSEQYKVKWSYRAAPKELNFTWELEKVMEEICYDALTKYWFKCSKQEVDEVRQFFDKKMWIWASQPSSSEPARKELEQVSTSPYTTPTKKRARLDDELSRGDLGRLFHRYDKPRGSNPKSNSENDILTTGIKSESPTRLKKEKCDEEIVKKYPAYFPHHNFGTDELIDSPQYEIGEVLETKKGSGSQRKTSYVVAWNYTSYETADSLGLTDDLMKKHFSLKAASSSSSSLKFQLQRDKSGKAIIKAVPVPSFIKTEVSKELPSSQGSESDMSDTSTHPPSELSSGPSAPRELFDDQLSDDGEGQKVEMACQTEIELDPFACHYCQAKIGERSSSRRRKETIKVEQRSPKKNETQVVSKKEDTQSDEEDDDDLVDIEYEVEHIVDYKKVEGTNADEYYVKWKGFTSQYNTWEPYSNLCNCMKVLITFYVNRMADRRQMEQEHLKNLAQKDGSNGTVVKKPLVLPALPPVPETIFELLKKVAPITHAEIEMAFKISKTVKKNSRWTKTKLRKSLLDLVGEPSADGSVPQPFAQAEMPVLRHQILMLEGERRKELILKDLKDWETHLNWVSQGRPEIVVENNYDLAGPPTDFKYINDNVIGEGVTFPDDTLEGCACEESCIKDKSNCCPGKHGKVVAYNIFKRLRVHPGYPIYECNKRCKCGPECTNRVVQDGTVSLIGTKLCIFRTSNDRGWGVKALKKIKRGSFVCLYAGEIITTEEAESRGQVYENQLGASYLFDLDYYAGGDDDDESSPYTIDATKMGNISHFINHSCDPNLCVFNVWADCLDQNLPKLAFFALREINKDEELTYDYGSQDDDQATSSMIPSTAAASLATPSLLPNGEVDPEDEMGCEIDPAMLTSSPAKNRMKRATLSAVRKPCLCGSSNCRKVLF